MYYVCVIAYLCMCIINPRRACAARVTAVVLCVCLCVCVCVHDYSRTTGYEAAYERYQQLQCYKGLKNNVGILLKRLRSRDMASFAYRDRLRWYYSDPCFVCSSGG